MIEGSRSIHLTNGSGSRRPKNTWIRIRIRKTDFQAHPKAAFGRYEELRFRHRFSKGLIGLYIEIGSSIAAPTWYQLLIRMFANTFCTEIPVVSKDVRVQFEGGVIIAADTLGSYGSLAKITNLDRVVKVRITV